MFAKRTAAVLAIVALAEFMLGVFSIYSKDPVLTFVALLAGVTQGMLAGAVIEMVLSGAVLTSCKCHWFILPAVVLTICGIMVGAGFATVGSYSPQNMGWTIGLIAVTFLSLVLTIT